MLWSLVVLFVGTEGKQESHREVEGFPRSRLLVFPTAHNFHEAIPKANSGL